MTLLRNNLDKHKNVTKNKKKKKKKKKPLDYGVPLGSKVYYQCDTLIILRVTLITLRATLIILRATLNNLRGT